MLVKLTKIANNEFEQESVILVNSDQIVAVSDHGTYSSILLTNNEVLSVKELTTEILEAITPN